MVKCSAPIMIAANAVAQNPIIIAISVSLKFIFLPLFRSFRGGHSPLSTASRINPVSENAIALSDSLPHVGLSLVQIAASESINPIARNI